MKENEIPKVKKIMKKPLVILAVTPSWKKMWAPRSIIPFIRHLEDAIRKIGQGCSGEKEAWSGFITHVVQVP
jgi:hypothetical protein